MDKKEQQKVVDTCLEIVNFLRQRHNAGPLILDPNETQQAQQLADRMIRGGPFQHDRKGQNLSYVGCNTVKPLDLIYPWYKEVHQYRGPGSAVNIFGEMQNKSGHFTQLVWKKSKKVGFGFTSNGFDRYLVANFLPWGNYLNDYDANVDASVRIPLQDFEARFGKMTKFGFVDDDDDGGAVADAADNGSSGWSGNQGFKGYHVTTTTTNHPTVVRWEGDRKYFGGGSSSSSNQQNSLQDQMDQWRRESEERMKQFQSDFMKNNSSAHSSGRVEYHFFQQ